MRNGMECGMEYGMCSVGPEQNNYVTTPTFRGFPITHHSYCQFNCNIVLEEEAWVNWQRGVKTAECGGKGVTQYETTPLPRGKRFLDNIVCRLSM